MSDRRNNTDKRNLAEGNEGTILLELTKKTEPADNQNVVFPEPQEVTITTPIVVSGVIITI